jgi:hypothetical protein
MRFTIHLPVIPTIQTWAVADLVHLAVIMECTERILSLVPAKAQTTFREAHMAVAAVAQALLGQTHQEMVGRVHYELYGARVERIQVQARLT